MFWVEEKEKNSKGKNWQSILRAQRPLEINLNWIVMPTKKDL
jgi:hypothetical protein